MAKQIADVYPNRALAGITMSGTDALTFEQIRFGVGIFQGVALLVHQIDYFLSLASHTQLTTSADYCSLALTARDDLTSLTPTVLNVIDVIDYNVVLFGTAAEARMIHKPRTREFNHMPGGGILIPANPLFLAMSSTGFASAGVARVVIYYTFKTLTDKDYLELLQSMLPANI